MELILPQELYEIIKDGFVKGRARPAYSRVIMPLKALLEGEFFNEYIKKGIRLLGVLRDSSANVFCRQYFDALRGKDWSG